MKEDIHHNEKYKKARAKAIGFGIGTIVSLIPAVYALIFVNWYNTTCTTANLDGAFLAKRTIANSPEIYGTMFVFSILAIVLAVNCIVNIVIVKKNNQWISDPEDIKIGRDIEGEN